MKHFNVLNLFGVVAIWLVICPNEGQGYEILDYNGVEDFHRYPLNRFNPRKRMGNGDQTTQDPSADGFIIFGNKSPGDDATIIYTNVDLTRKNSDANLRRSTKKSYSNNAAQLKYGQSGRGIKVLYKPYPATVIFRPSTL